MPTVHHFSSTSEAYSASQTREDIHDGDVLAVISERVVGILVDAWPTAISEAHGEFHRLDPDVSWDHVPRTSWGDTPIFSDYSVSFTLAREELEIMQSAGVETTLRRGTHFEDLSTIYTSNDGTIAIERATQLGLGRELLPNGGWCVFRRNGKNTNEVLLSSVSRDVCEAFLLGWDARGEAI